MYQRWEVKSAKKGPAKNMCSYDLGAGTHQVILLAMQSAVHFIIFSHDDCHIHKESISIHIMRTGFLGSSEMDWLLLSHIDILDNELYAIDDFP